MIRPYVLVENPRYGINCFHASNDSSALLRCARSNRYFPFETQALHDRLNGVLNVLSEIAARLGIRTPVEHAVFSGKVSVLTGLLEAIFSILAGESL